MTRANRNFESTRQAFPMPEGFNPGGDDFGVVRMVDGHNPAHLGTEGSNVHVPSSGADPEWHNDFTQYDPDDAD